MTKAKSPSSSQRTIRMAFVTGADGFIGSHLVEALCEAGVQVRALAQYNSFDGRGWLDSLTAGVAEAIEIVSGDIRDAHAMNELVKGCDTVFHLAALIGIPYSYKAPEAYIETNVVGTLNLLQAGRANEVERFVHTSTSEVYGSARSVPMSEEHPLHPQSPYAASKVGADQLALSFFRSFETPVVVLRPFNNYGPRQSTRAVIPTIITQALATGGSVKIGDTRPTRDFLFVTDTARAFIAAATAENVCGETFNAGSDFEISVGEIIELVGELTGRSLNPESDRSRHRPSGSEVTRLRADISRARERLGWDPEFGGKEGFKRGLAVCVDWYGKNAHLFRSGRYAI